MGVQLRIKKQCAPWTLSLFVGLEIEEVLNFHKYQLWLRHPSCSTEGNELTEY